jgi:5-methylthioadenosine/S-adenosylhomocysteine deaminase
MNTPQPVDLLIAPQWIVPVVPRGLVLQEHALVVDAGSIVDMLPIAEARQRYLPRQSQYLPGQAVMPGLVNLHTHAAMSLMRGLADDIALMPWLKEHIWPAEHAFVSEAFVNDGSLLACAEMIRGGTTCFADMYFYPMATAAAVQQAGMRASLGLVVIDFPTGYAADADDYLNKGLAARDALNGISTISTIFAPHAPYTVGDRTFEKLLTFSGQLDLGIHVHLHETQGEITESVSQYGIRPLQRLANLGMLGPGLIAAHGVHLTPAEIELLAEHGCHIAHCPTSNLKLASGIAPVADLIAHSVNIGLGTDGAASNNRLDMFGEMRTAALLAKGASGDAEALPAWQALEMATLNAARALGLEAVIGSLEIGKAADLIAVDLADVETQPCFDVVSHLVYAAGRSEVTHVWVEGRCLLSEGQLTTLDRREVLEKAKLWQKRLQAKSM